MSEALALPVPRYEAPEDMEDFGERVADGKKFILYLGDRAVVDVIEIQGLVDGVEVLGTKLASVEAPKEKGVDLLYHTANYMPANEAKAIFDPPKFTVVE